MNTNGMILNIYRMLTFTHNLPRLSLDAHLFELGPYRYYQGKGV